MTDINPKYLKSKNMNNQKILNKNSHSLKAFIIDPKRCLSNFIAFIEKEGMGYEIEQKMNDPLSKSSIR